MCKSTTATATFYRPPPALYSPLALAPLGILLLSGPLLLPPSAPPLSFAAHPPQLWPSTDLPSLSETTSIPTNPRTTRPVGYAFVDVSAPSEAERAIQELNGKTILDRKVSVQLARKPEPAQEGAEGQEGTRRRSSTRGRGRGRARGGRAGRGGRGVS